MYEILPWLRIARTNGLGSIGFNQLYLKHKDPNHITEKLMNSNKKVPSIDSVMEEIDKTHAFGARFVFRYGKEYPKLLKQIPDAPIFLIVKGKLEPEAHYISIVGSRNGAIASNKIAFTLAEKLVDCGYTVVSGLARGIDRYAHLGGIKSTVAVLGCGIDQIYPAENKDLYDAITYHGCIVSEFPIGTQPSSHSFPARNRIIAGLSIGCVIVQGTKYSGSLITANLALEYNREVFAVPGCPLDPRSYAPNSLIKNGATLIENHNDVLKQMPDLYICDSSVQEENIAVTELDLDNALEYKILNSLSATPITIDSLQNVVDLPVTHLRQILMELEMKNKIAYTYGDRVFRVL